MRCDYFHRQPRDARFIVRAFNRAIPPMQVCKQHITMASVTMLSASGAGFVTIGFIEEGRKNVKVKARSEAGRGNATATVRRVRGIRNLPEL